ncbi:hypothetical protein HHI36_010511 [Cryptolaemus montrouzieri]|uniref:Uncharacterized protein n=1 Tax=Cryptolaemus montrouzieri TaxID=559131 RepID=A0ABD2MIY0_9CUCU
MLASAFWRELDSCQSILNLKQLRQLMDTLDEIMLALKAVGLNTDQWDFVITSMMLNRVDGESKTIFEMDFASNDIPTHNLLEKSPIKQCNAMDLWMQTKKFSKLSLLKEKPQNKRVFFINMQGAIESLIIQLLLKVRNR